MKKNLSIKLIRSLIGRPEKQRKIVRALGLRRINHEVLHMDTPSIRGMIHKIPHMVDVKEAKGDRK
jgi:large subunit ribosomal protein L30